MKESDIRPQELFQEYLRLSALDAELCFKDATRHKIPCPGCGEVKSNFAFEKHGFEYVTCNECQSLFQSPRPDIEFFVKFYNDSVSSNFWAEEFFPKVAEARRNRIFRPRVERLIALCEEKQVQVDTVMDVGAGYGIFLDEWAKNKPDCRRIAIEPSANLAQICRKRGLEVVEAIAEDVQGYDKTADLVICFEVLEHVHDPLSFIKVLKKFVKPGGYLMVSTLGCDGFDIQLLWEKSNSVSPPHHINFMSVSGFEKLFERSGLVDVDLLTPGVLDVDIVRNAWLKDPASMGDNRFINALMKDDKLATNFQKFLVENRMSSHSWVLAKNVD